jgi:co-chaperonin GroES (HSP10)
LLTPVLHRIIVKPRKVEEANETYKKMKALGLEIPDTNDRKREDKAVEIGTVVSIGDTAFLDFKANVIPKVGDSVYYAKYSGKTVKDSDDSEYLALNDEDIIAIIS